MAAEASYPENLSTGWTQYKVAGGTRHLYALVRHFPGRLVVLRCLDKRWKPIEPPVLELFGKDVVKKEVSLKRALRWLDGYEEP